MIHRKYSDCVGPPKLLHVKDNIYALQFYIMKLTPAKYIIERAYRDGRINPAFPVVDTSSGTFALGIGIICAELGQRFIVFGDSAIDPFLKNRLELLGGEVVTVSGGGQQSPQQARLEALHYHLHCSPESFWPQQYDNPEVLESYSFAADLVSKSISGDITLVASVGSGGSACGLIQWLRMRRPNTKLVGVDTFGSVLFGLENGPKELRGLGNSIMPGNLRHDAFDLVHWVDREGAFYHTSRLLQDYAIFAGPTSGAAYQVALLQAAEEPDRSIVFVAPDWGYRYPDVFELIGSRAETARSDLNEPLTVESPAMARRPWSVLHWRQRTLADVANARAAVTES